MLLLCLENPRTMAGKIYRDSGLGDILMVKSARARRVSIRVHPEKGVVVTVPAFLRYDDGLRFFMQKRDWVADALRRQKARCGDAEMRGTAVGLLRSGALVKTLLSRIVFRRQGADRAEGMEPAASPAFSTGRKEAHQESGMFCGTLFGQEASGAEGRGMQEDTAPVPGGMSASSGYAARRVSGGRSASSGYAARRGRGGRSASKGAVVVSSSLVEDVKKTGRVCLGLEMPISEKLVEYPDSMPPEGSPELSSLLSQVLVRLLRDEAKSLLPQKLAFFARRYGFVYNSVAIKHNSTNWGSCSTRGNINLNLNLVRLPEPVCDYVVLHELCHLRHPDHGADFHALLERLCADNMKRLSFLMDSLHEPVPGQGNDTGHAAGVSAVGSLPGAGIRAEKEYFRSLVSQMRRSRAQFPVHHLLEKEVRKYRLV